jgi:outer membrane protein assembly factor BamB
LSHIVKSHIKIKHLVWFVLGLGGILILACGHPTPILLHDAEHICNWSQGGGSPARIAYVPTNAYGYPRALWRQPQETSLLVEPTAGLGFIFVPTTSSRIIILSYNDGTKFGEIKFKGPIPAPCGLIDSLIVVNEDGRRMVIENWVVNRRIWQVDLKGTDFEPLIFNKRVFWEDGGGMFHCYEVHEGKRIWEKKLDFKLESPAAACSLGVVVPGSGPIIECLSPEDGHMLWKVNMDARIRNALEIVGDTVLYCTVAGRVGTLNIRDGSKIWEVDAGPEIISPPATDGEGIYIGTNTGRLMRLNFETGQFDWQLNIDSPVKAGATIFGDLVVFVSLNHKAYFVDKRDGTIMTDFETRGMLSARPIACSNRIFIAGEDKNLYCFQVTEE